MIKSADCRSNKTFCRTPLNVRADISVKCSAFFSAMIDRIRLSYFFYRVQSFIPAHWHLAWTSDVAFSESFNDEQKIKQTVILTSRCERKFELEFKLLM